MRIGIDARFLTHPQQGGFKTYAQNLLNALAEIEQRNTFVVYVDRIPSESTLLHRDNFLWKSVGARLPLVSMPVREQIALRREILTDNLDLVHFLANTATLNLPVKTLITLHDVIQLAPTGGIFDKGRVPAFKRWATTEYSRQVILRTAPSAHRIVTVSQYERGEIARVLGIEPGRISVTHLAANPVFRPTSREQKELGKAKVRELHGIRGRFVLGVGYEPRKNIPLLIGAFAHIAADHPDLDLVIVAAEKASSMSFRRLAQAWNISARVTVLNGMRGDDLALLYNLAEVLVYPSERESFGLPPLEAMACGTPVVAMNLTSIPEIAGDAALLVAGKDVDAWAAAIARVMTDGHLRDGLSRRGIERAAAFSWRRTAQDTLQLYQAVAEEG